MAAKQPLLCLSLVKVDHERDGSSGSRSGSGTGHAGHTAACIPARPRDSLQGAWQRHRSFQIALHSRCSAGTGTTTMQGLDGWGRSRTGVGTWYSTDIVKKGGPSRQRGAKSDPNLGSLGKALPAGTRAVGPGSLGSWRTPPSPGSSWQAGPAANVHELQEGFSFGSWHSTDLYQRLSGWKCRWVPLRPPTLPIAAHSRRKNSFERSVHPTRESCPRISAERELEGEHSPGAFCDTEIKLPVLLLRVEKGIEKLEQIVHPSLEGERRKKGIERCWRCAGGSPSGLPCPAIAGFGWNKSKTFLGSEMS